MPVFKIPIYDFFDFSDPNTFIRDDSSDGAGQVGETLQILNEPSYTLRVDDNDPILSDDDLDVDGTQSTIATEFQIDRNGDDDTNDAGETFAAGLRVESEYSFIIENSDGSLQWEVHIVQFGTGSSPRPAVMISRGYDVANGQFTNIKPPINEDLTAIDGSGTVFEDAAGGGGDQFNSNGIYSNRPFVEFSQVVCFASGTLIMCQSGEKKVEDLCTGDLVLTRDNGLQPVIWSGVSRVEIGSQNGPVTFEPGTVGNDSSLVVSPQHRFLLNSGLGEAYFGKSTFLVRAKDMVDRLSGVSQCKDPKVVCYHHVLLPRHEIIYAAGAEAESLFPGPAFLEKVTPDTKAKIEDGLGQFGSSLSDYECETYTTLKPHEVAVLFQSINADDSAQLQRESQTSPPKSLIDA